MYLTINEKKGSCQKTATINKVFFDSYAFFCGNQASLQQIRTVITNRMLMMRLTACSTFD
jgi:hypothetical protein